MSIIILNFSKKTAFNKINILLSSILINEINKRVFFGVLTKQALGSLISQINSIPDVKIKIFIQDRNCFGGFREMYQIDKENI